MTRTLSALVPFLLAAFSTLGPSGSANAATEHVIDIFRPEKVVHPIALPQFVADGASDPTWSAGLPDAIGRDLEFTGLFRVLERSAYLEKPGAVKPSGEGTKWEDWRVLKTSLLVRGGYRVAADKVVVKIWVFNATDGERLGEFLAFEPPSRKDVLAHRLADAVYEIATGEKGIFSSQLVFVSDRSGHKEIFTARFDGSQEQAVTRNRSINLSPSWSPDGAKLSFTSYVRNRPDLYSYDRKTDKFSRVSDRSGINVGGVWSPHGRVMAATLSSEGGNPDIYLMGEDGKGAKRLTDHWASDVSPTWSPDARNIAFVSDRGGTPNVYVLDVDSPKEPVRVTFEANGCGKDNQAPAWSPRGDRIAFQSRVGGTWQIFTMKPDGSEVRQVTSTGNNEDPAWSPDGRLLAFVHGGKLWVMEADGTNARQVASSTGQYSNVAWSPRLSW